MIKRILLFVLTNILVVVTLSIVLSLLGVKPYLTAQGIDYSSLMVFCFVWGMGGAFISLFMSRFMAKMFMGVKVIPADKPGQYMELVNTVHNIAKRANLNYMPEVGIYESPEMNAFATGPSQRMSLVAVSTGLVNQMNRDELEGVLAHEIAHIKNGDMVTMTLLQGIINAFVMFFARIAAFFITQAMSSNRDSDAPVGGGFMHMMIVMFLEIIFSLLGMIVVMAFSRRREFSADAGAAKFVGANKMAAALEAIKRSAERIPVDSSNQALATLKINGGSKSWMSILASHPPIEERIKALRTGSFA